MTTGKNNLSIVEFVINNSPAQSTGYTFFSLLLGIIRVLRSTSSGKQKILRLKNVKSVYPEDAAGVFHEPNSFCIKRRNGRRSKLTSGDESRCST